MWAGPGYLRSEEVSSTEALRGADLLTGEALGDRPGVPGITHVIVRKQVALSQAEPFVSESRGGSASAANSRARE